MMRSCEISAVAFESLTTTHRPAERMTDGSVSRVMIRSFGSNRGRSEMGLGVVEKESAWHRQGSLDGRVEQHVEPG